LAAATVREVITAQVGTVLVAAVAAALAVPVDRIELVLAAAQGNLAE
jgi:hypothetical protein